MYETYYFHICGEAGAWMHGEGITAFEAAVKAIGQKRAEALARNTKQTRYMNGDREVAMNESGVSEFYSRNGIAVASVTKLVSPAAALRSIPSEKRAQASRDNGKNGGRPKKSA